MTKDHVPPPASTPPVRPPQRVYGPDDFEKAVFDAHRIPNCWRDPEYHTDYGAWLDRDHPDDGGEEDNP